ncbi:putative RNA polymerase ECF-subfamily sigma factor [Actinoplanes missouriensis 431]|uniref:Putative RNA polymerase ECF-subfamily sigma factor n=1 Tax=Actinoplanes missouriensis (strain ATCC 14538 / DSM 43046 / CBS 188.64 / JCM 3121 / NBRC 102363 / NCIMB 12654 / NRRL B-3342 / UNCC 431) TaxID=512565 RepID=I0HEX3_ACTM4|nr:SigE family RNA polymerase sigma factor [Actinoplanes missouriensis]BAL91560.1 putative RNA polymerase ECF-subfamily sigma factor [Actinoplanes missouriensis 431]
MGQTADFDAFYASTARRVMLQVYAVCGDLGDAQDLTQEAYARAWQRWPEVSGYDSPEHWVRRVAWNLAANRWRGLRRWLAAQSRSGPPPETTDGPSPERVALLAALRRLPHAQRQAVAMHYLMDMSVEEIASSDGVPAGTVKARLSRARTALAPLLTDVEVSDAA